MSKKYAVLIPVRSGSERVPNKNIRSFAGTTLLGNKIEQVKNIKNATVYVSSDSDEMLDIAMKYGVEALKRPKELASSLSSINDVYEYMARQVSEEHIIFTHVTNPLCDYSHYAKAVEEYEKLDYVYDSLTTVTAIQDFLYKNGTAMNFDAKHKPRSQDLEIIYKLNHAISILPRTKLIENRNIIGQKPFLMEIDSIIGYDIDSLVDFKIAEFLMNELKVNKI